MEFWILAAGILLFIGSVFMFLKRDDKAYNAVLKHNDKTCEKFQKEKKELVELINATQAIALNQIGKMREEFQKQIANLSAVQVKDKRELGETIASQGLRCNETTFKVDEMDRALGNQLNDLDNFNDKLVAMRSQLLKVRKTKPVRRKKK